MDTLPLDLSQSPNREALEGFLEGCKLRAIEKEHAQLISISVESDLLDPLAVLESIYEPTQPHFYVERPLEGVALAGAEVAVRYTPDGTARFKGANDFIEGTLENAIAIGDVNLPFFGPHFFCGFTFFHEVALAEPFPAASVFVPSWQVSVKDSRCVATANALVGIDSDTKVIAARIWNANTKFKSFDYHAVESKPDERDRSKWRVETTDEEGGTEGFGQAVAAALEEIEDGAFDKIVLARAQDLRANQSFHPLEILNALRDRFSDCYSFSFANGKGQSFIGASPERLVQLEGGTIATDALAGSAPRGASAAEDARFGTALLRSEKDRREQKVVLDSMIRRLADLGVEASTSDYPKLKRLSNVQHLCNEITGSIPDGIGLLDFVENLHPSPAVGGSPREAACKRIPDLERFDRGLYAGPIGWVNSRGEGEFFVSIRSALVDGDSARLYAGVGIVEGSVPEKEIQETDLKFKALLENLL
ncbi:MAG: isochorismate synthase MenF [Opitutales bacterium]